MAPKARKRDLAIQPPLALARLPLKLARGVTLTSRQLACPAKKLAGTERISPMVTRPM